MNLWLNAKHKKKHLQFKLMKIPHKVKSRVGKTKLRNAETEKIKTTLKLKINKKYL